MCSLGSLNVWSGGTMCSLGSLNVWSGGTMCSLGSLNVSSGGTMCSRSASVETGLIYRSHIQILILTRQVKITPKKLCLYKLNKTTNTIILLYCKCSILFLSQLQI